MYRYGVYGIYMAIYIYIYIIIYMVIAMSIICIGYVLVM